MPRQLAAVVALLAGLAMFVAACGDSNDESGGGNAAKETATPAKAAGPAAKCGLGNGQKATGEPIKLGAHRHQAAGHGLHRHPEHGRRRTSTASTTTAASTAGRSSTCIETEQTDPGQVASLAKKLIETDKVARHRRQHAASSSARSTTSTTSQGLLRHRLGHRARVLLDAEHRGREHGPALQRRRRRAVPDRARRRQEDRVRPVQRARAPATSPSGFQLIAKDAGIPTQRSRRTCRSRTPTRSRSRPCRRPATAAACVLNFTPPEALKILQAAQQQGLQDRVKWALLDAVQHRLPGRRARGRQWNDKLFVNAELNLTNADGPDTPALPRGAASSTRRRSRSAASARWASCEAAIADQGAAERSRATSRAESVNEAFKNVKDFKTDILCKPWYYGDAPLHIPNNIDRTTTPKDGKMVEKEDCFPISDVDPAITQVREIEAKGGERVARAELAGLPAVHRHRPGPGRGVRPVRGRDGGALPGDRRAEPGVRRGRRDGRVHRVVAHQQPRRGRRASPTSSASLFGGVVTLAYGMLFGPPLAGRDPLVKAIATLGPRADPARRDVVDLERQGALDGPADDELGLLGRRRAGQLDADHRARCSASLVTVGHRRVPALHEPRHGDAGAGQRPRDHGDARRAGAARRGGRVARLRADLRAPPGCCCRTSSGSTPRR